MFFGELPFLRQPMAKKSIWWKISFILISIVIFTCVCCGVNFKTAAITFMSVVVLFELMLLVKYWKMHTINLRWMPFSYQMLKILINSIYLKHDVFQIFKFGIRWNIIWMVHWNLWQENPYNTKKCFFFHSLKSMKILTRVSSNWRDNLLFWSLSRSLCCSKMR